MSTGDQIWGGETTSDERTLALLTHLAGFVVPILGSLVLYMVKKDQSRFVAYHSLQATIFQILAWAIGGATCGIGLVLLVIPILWAMKAHKGEWEGYPLLASIGREA